MKASGLSEFLAMGGYGFYVWTSYIVAAIAVAVEIVAVRARLHPNDRTGLAARDDHDGKHDRSSVHRLRDFQRPADRLARDAARRADLDGLTLRLRPLESGRDNGRNSKR